MSISVIKGDGTDDYEIFAVSSLQSQETDFGGQHSLIEVYRVRRTDNVPVRYQGYDLSPMYGFGVAPMVGTRYESWNSTASEVAHKLFRLRSIEWQSNPDGSANFTLTWSGFWYVNPLEYVGCPGCDPPLSPNLYYWLPAHFEYNASLKSTVMWRKGWTVSPQTNTDTTADIGLAASGSQVPIPTEVPQVRIRLRFLRDATYDPMIDQYTALSTYLGKINNDTFLNFPAGSVICEGINMIPVQNEFYETTMDFLYDDWFHHEQAPKLNPDNSVFLNSTDKKPSEVKWDRMPRTAIAFNGIFSDATQRAIIEQGYWNPVP